jgi:hypothetical protein
MKAFQHLSACTRRNRENAQTHNVETCPTSRETPRTARLGYTEMTLL